jgi:catechol 2,3-dioxygenase
MSALWPARLHHLRRDSHEPEKLARFYGSLLGDEVSPLPNNEWRVAGRGRVLVVGAGEPAAIPYFALDLGEARRVEASREALAKGGTACRPFSSPLLAPGAFAVTDPDGRRVVFGVALAAPSANGGLPARLQHFVCATTRLEAMTAFYRDILGMLESDRVLEGSELSATFLRSDPEHHSFAAFRAPQSRPDHHCYETTSWNDIRDWADRMAQLRIPLWWGPGRHGPGNNLFFMIEDPEGHKVEFSAELEIMPRELPVRTWPHEERTLNLWGSAWMRS